MPPKLDAWLASADKDLKLEMDKDDTAWKHVCDAARTEIRYESRYKQTKQHMDKARERVSSVDQLSNIVRRPVVQHWIGGLFRRSANQTPRCLGSPGHTPSGYNEQSIVQGR